MVKKAKKKVESEVETIKEKVIRLNSMDKTKGIQSFIDGASDEYFERISSGIPEVDDILGGGWPRGCIAELYGLESSGKTWLLTKLYAECCRRNIPFLHYDAENSYNPSFAQQNGVDLKKIMFSQDNVADNIFRQIMMYCETNEFAVFGIDSLASLATEQEMEKDTNEMTMGSLARCMSRNLKKIAPLIKKSNSILVFVNQMREQIGGFSPTGKPPMVTPGGKALKFYSSIRIETKKILPKKAERPDMYDGDMIIGHILKSKVIKNRTAPPFGEALCDLMYRPVSEIIQLIKIGLEKDILCRKKRADGTGIANAKHITYMDEVCLLPNKTDIAYLQGWLHDRGVLCNFLSEMGVEDFDKFIKDGVLSEVDVENFMTEKEI